MDCADIILQLYQTLISKDQVDQELIDSVTQKLINFYKIPETLEILIDQYSKVSDESIQLIIAIGIKQILLYEKSWELFRQYNKAENIKNLLIQILQKEKSLLLFQNVVESTSPILKTDFMEWPEYIELTRLYSTNEENILFSIIMANTIIKYIKTSEFLESIWDFFTSLALQGISSTDDIIIKESSDLIANLFEFVTTIDTNLPGLFSSLLQVFSNLISSNSPICGNIIQNFERISEIPDFCFPNSVEIAGQFLQFINSSNDIDLKCILLSPLISFLYSDPESDKSEILSTLYEDIFTISTNSFIKEECKDDQENMLICNDNIRRLLEESECEEICKQIFEKGSGNNSNGEIMTYALSLISIAQIYPEVLLKDISPFLEFGFCCIETDNRPVQETGFELLETLFTHQNEAYYGIQDRFLEIVNLAFAIENLPLLTKILNSLNKYLNFITIKKEHINNLFLSLFQVFKENDDPNIQSQVVDCFTSLMMSLMDDISPYSNEILPIAFQLATEANKPEECNLKASAVKCLGMLIQYKDIIPEIEPIIKIFFDCVNSDDDVLKSAGIQGLSKPVCTFFFRANKERFLHLKPFLNSEWFENVFGFKETIININDFIDISETELGILLCSYKIKKSFLAGRFSTKNFSLLSNSIQEILSNGQFPQRQEGTFSILGGFNDLLNTFSIPEFNGATFQVETNFNCLNNICSDQTSKDGVSYYIYNNITGSQAAVSTAASLVYRNYYLTLGSQNKINLIENTSLAVKEGFSLINDLVFAKDDEDLDFNYNDLDNYEIGVQENCQVILTRYGKKELALLPYDQIVHQVFVSSLDFSKKKNNSIKQITKIEPFLLEAEYKSTILAAWENSLKFPNNPGSNKCFLTIIGYELYNVPLNIAFNAIKSCQSLIIESGLEVYLIPNDQNCFSRACKNLDQLVNQTSGMIIP